MPTPGDDPSHPIAAVFDRVADRYENVGVPWFEPIAAGLVELVAPQPGARVVDLGCGTGAVLVRLAAAVGADGHVLGVDFSPRMAQVARRRLAQLATVSGEVLVRDASDPGLPSGEADLVTASLVLFFLADPAAALSRWAALLRPGGVLGVSTFGPQDPVWQRLDALFLPYLPPAMRDARTSGARGPFASDDGVEALLGSAGLVEVRTSRRPVQVEFADVDAWSTWSHSHGQQAMWDHVPQGEVPALRGAAAALLHEAFGDGPARLTQQVRYTLGSAPG